MKKNVSIKANLFLKMLLMVGFTAACFHAQGATSAPLVNPALAKAEVISRLLSSLANDVDDCFNPNHSDVNARAKQKFLSLVAKVQAIEADISSGNAQNLMADVDFLEATIKSFDDQAPFPANLTCGTERGCLELGFAGDAKYPRCLPVNGDNHANAQYLDLEELLDKALPELLASLQGTTQIS